MGARQSRAGKMDTPSRKQAARLSHRFAGLTIILGIALTALASVAGLPPTAQYLPLALSVVILGLPHGAVDHLVIPRARGECVTGRSMAAVGLLYLVAGTAYAAVWFLTPVAAFAFFILLTLAHWGQGDVYALRELTGVTYLESTAQRVGTLLVRGGLPMLIPLIAFPRQYEAVAGALIGLFDPASAAALEGALTLEVRAAVAIAFGGLIALTLARGFLRSADNRRPWLIDTAETLGLVTYFSLVPPILAIGLYFPLWHSLRHILRTILLESTAREALSGGQLTAAFGKFAREAAPLTLGALVVLGGIWLAVPQTPATVPDVLGLYLVTIAVLTLPHVVVVSILDAEQGIWA